MVSYLPNILKAMTEQQATDAYLTMNSRAILRVDGVNKELDGKILQEIDLLAIVDEILDRKAKENFFAEREYNTAINCEDGGRYRANLFWQQQHVAVVIRKVQTKIPSTESLGVPKVIKELMLEDRGLILISGASGNGKTTSLASLLEYRNNVKTGHILTIEDPIEYLHTHKKCVFNQREVGIDTVSYAAALKNALRQTVDVIAVGEIRDKETMEYAMHFAETGHLCIATIHANNTDQTLSRLVNLFPADEQVRLLSTLSQVLLGVVCQKLFWSEEEERMMITEVLLNKGGISSLIEKGKLNKIKELMSRSQDENIYTFDQSLFLLVQAGVLSKEIALLNADSKTNLNVRLNNNNLSCYTKNEMLSRALKDPDTDF